MTANLCPICKAKYLYKVTEVCMSTLTYMCVSASCVVSHFFPISYPFIMSAPPPTHKYIPIVDRTLRLKWKHNSQIMPEKKWIKNILYRNRLSKITYWKVPFRLRYWGFVWREKVTKIHRYVTVVLVTSR